MKYRALLGVDDWAYRKHHTYGTILVDLEKHQPIDLLSNRTASTLAQWLEAHPGILYHLQRSIQSLSKRSIFRLSWSYSGGGSFSSPPKFSSNVRNRT